MANCEKFNDDAMLMVLKHATRQLKNDSNKDIDDERSCMNYSIKLDHNGLSDMEYYQKLIADSYLYGRGTKREKDAVTCFGWVVTLPKSISDYSSEKRDLNPKAEKQFFRGVLQFVSERYGAENIVSNQIHYDEGGQPHIHIYVAARKALNRDLVHYSTEKAKSGYKTSSGRYEYEIKYKLQDGTSVPVTEYDEYLKTEGAIDTRIPLKNYAKFSDMYDYKIAAAEIINPIELRHFHEDLAEYFRKNNLPGAESVHNGGTIGKKVTIAAMKYFTKETGLTIEEAKELLLTNKNLDRKIAKLEQKLKSRNIALSEKDKLISELQQQLSDYERKVSSEKEISRWDRRSTDKDIDFEGGRW